MISPGHMHIKAFLNGLNKLYMHVCMCVCIHKTIIINEEVTNFVKGDTRGDGRIGSDLDVVLMYKTLKT